MKNSRIIFAMVVLFIAGSTTLLSAQDNTRGKHRERAFKKERTERRDHRTDAGFNLSPEQKENMKAARLSFQKETLPMKNELREKKAQLRTLTTVESPDMKTVNKVIDEIGAIQTKMMKAKVAQRQAMRKELTEEQRIAFDSHSKRGRHRN